MSHRIRSANVSSLRISDRLGKRYKLRGIKFHCLRKLLGVDSAAENGRKTL